MDRKKNKFGNHKSARFHMFQSVPLRFSKKTISLLWGLRTRFLFYFLISVFFYFCMWKIVHVQLIQRRQFLPSLLVKEKFIPKIPGKPEDYKADNFPRWPDSATLRYQPLFRKGARTHCPKSPLVEERRADSRERRKSSMSMNSQNAHLWIQFLIVRILLVHSEKQCLRGHRKRAWSEHTWCYQMTGGCEHHVTGNISTQASIFNDDFSDLFLVQGVGIRGLCGRNCGEVEMMRSGC